MLIGFADNGRHQNVRNIERARIRNRICSIKRIALNDQLMQLNRTGLSMQGEGRGRRREENGGEQKDAIDERRYNGVCQANEIFTGRRAQKMRSTA